MVGGPEQTAGQAWAGEEEWSRQNSSLTKADKTSGKKTTKVQDNPQEPPGNAKPQTFQILPTSPSLKW